MAHSSLLILPSILKTFLIMEIRKGQQSHIALIVPAPKDLQEKFPLFARGSWI